MSADRDFDPLVGGGAGGAYQTGDKWGFATAEKVRQALDQSAYLGLQGDLGGDAQPILTSSYVAVNAARTFTLNGDTLGGLTLEAVVWYFTTAAATSVRVRVRNLTDGSDAAVGTLSTATTKTKETLTLTLASGVKEYELQVVGGNTDNGVMAWGRLQLRKVAA